MSSPRPTAPIRTPLASARSWDMSCFWKWNSRGETRFIIFSEIGRAKIGNYRNGEPSIIRKLTKYRDYYDTDDCEREWNFIKFRVITVVRNANKPFNLSEWLSENLSHHMFWVTTEPLFKEGIGDRIFRRRRTSRNAFIPSCISKLNTIQNEFWRRIV